MNIDNLNPIKRKVVWMLRLFNTLHKKQHAKTLRETLENTENPLIKTLHNITKETADHISPYVFQGDGAALSHQVHERYKDMILVPMEFFLSIPYIDTAYIDPFTYAAYRFGKECRENPVLWDYLEKNVKQPSMWYKNAWEDFKKETHDQTVAGELIEGQKSEGESLLVDEFNHKRLQDFADRQQQHQKRFRHW